MAPVVPSGEPTSLRAGATWLWDTAFGDYPRTEGWALTYELRGLDKITLSGSQITANSDGWHVIVPASFTTPLDPDSYEFLAVLTGSGTYAGRVDVITLPRLQILPNLITAAAGDRTSFVQVALGKVEAAIQARILGDEPEGYMVDGTQVQRMQLKELMALRIRLTEELRVLRGAGFGRVIQHRFKVPSA